VNGGAVIDRESLLVEVSASMPLGACEDLLAAEGLTLGLDPLARETPLGAWLAQGAEGAPDAWSDPADHLVAGLEARLLDGTRLSIRPAPRRAVGPDLIALFVGAGERYGRIDRVWLRVRVRGAPPARVHPYAGDRDPPCSAAEEALFEAIEGALRGALLKG
jgi:alkyldihydroxyacetonephosphate synthase